jgi:glycosyltransferase involved in cell wall biosynthesis
MIRIAFLFSTLEGFGLVKIIFYLAKYLKRNSSFDIHVITLSPEPKNSLINEFQKENIPVHCIGMSRIKGMFYSQKELIRLLNELQINILHSNGFRANLIHSQTTRKVTHIKDVMTIHLDPNDEAKHPLGPLFKLWSKNKHIKIIKECKCALACSRSISEGLKKYGIQIPYIQNGIDIEIIEQTGSSKEAKLELNIPNDSPLFVVLSGLHKRKNVETIIKAFNELGHNYPLLIIGDGDDRENLEMMAKGKHIHFLGYKKETIEFLKSSDIFLSASYSEGLPLSVMEAMYMENIPVLSRIPPHLEIIEKSNLIKYSFDNDDVDAIITYCHALKNNDLSELKKEAKNIITEHFSANRMTEDYISLYKSLI